MRLTYRCLPVLLFLILAFFLWRGLAGHPQDLPSVQLGKMVPVIDLPSLMGSKQGSFSSSEWRGNVVLLNVWSSWCDSCADEQDFLLNLAHQGFIIHWINEQYDSDAAMTWLKTYGNPYQTIGVDQHGQAAMDLGVYATPETFLIDQHGMIRWRHVGPLTPAIWRHDFLPKIQQLQEATA